MDQIAEFFDRGVQQFGAQHQQDDAEHRQRPDIADEGDTEGGHRDAEQSLAGAADENAAAGVLPAAVKCVAAQGDGLYGGLLVLEQFIPFDPAGALAAGALPVLNEALAGARLLLEGEAAPQPGEPYNATSLTGRIMLLELVVMSLATLAASPGSGLPATERMAIVKEVAGAMQPALQFIKVLGPAQIAQVMRRLKAASSLLTAVMRAGGAPVALELSNPKDLKIHFRLGPPSPFPMNAAPEGVFLDRAAGLSRMIMAYPPVRIGLAATGAVSAPPLAPPLTQVMPTYAPPAAHLPPAPAPAAPATAAVPVAAGARSAGLWALCMENA